MIKSLTIQIGIAYVTTALTAIYAFFSLIGNPIEFPPLTYEQKVYFVSLIISDIFISFGVIYGILYIFWNALTYCWRDGDNSSLSFTIYKAFGLIICIISHLCLFRFIFIKKITFVNKNLMKTGYILLLNFLFVFIFGLGCSIYRIYKRNKRNRQIDANINLEHYDFSE